MAAAPARAPHYGMPGAGKLWFKGRFHRSMNLFRLLILGALAWFIYRVLRSWSDEGGPRKPRSPRPDQYELMGRCLRCGTFVPRDSLSDSGRCRSCERLPRDAG
jgi:hypothetical protein